MIFNPVVPIAKKIEAIQAKDIAVGSSVYLNEDGNYVEYIVVNQGIPSNSNLYDGSCNGTLLLRKDIHSNRQWNTSNVNDYKNSNINTWLNGEFFNGLGTVEQAAIKQVKIPYVNGTGSSAVASGVDGLSVKIFLLSGYEVGWTTSDDQYFPVDGAKLDYFAASSGGNSKRIAYLNGSAAYWWPRSPYTSGTGLVWDVRSDGDSSNSSASVSFGIRPALILPFNAEFDKTNMRLVGATTYPANFADATWAQIIDACENNTVPDTWVVGNQKTMTINGADYAIDIIGKYHDTYSDGSGTAPLTFQLHDCYSGFYVMNSSNTNAGGWTSCAIRAERLPAILALMPGEVQAGIKEVNKLTSAGSQSSTINTTADKLFLLSEIEIFGDTSYSTPGEGTQYEYYKVGNSKVKHENGNTVIWWERSPVGVDTAAFCYVANGGYADNGGASGSCSISFAFCF